MKELNYLDFVLNSKYVRNGQIEKPVKKTSKVLESVWSIENRKFGENFKRRVIMLYNLVKSIV